MDWTPVFIAAIVLAAALLYIGLKLLWRKHIRPWLETNHLAEDAKLVVTAVEALVGRHHGDEKWAIALKKMQEKGWNIDAEAVQDALAAAWKLLDLEQIASGEKEANYEDE